MDLDKIVCECMSVTTRMIKDAVEDGATTLEEVREVTGATAACGACTDEVQRLVDYFTTERDAQ
ncbi:MAG: (2Fe-2S)-binding protein [Lachnospiraceae bacterium]